MHVVANIIRTQLESRACSLAAARTEASEAGSNVAAAGRELQHCELRRRALRRDLGAGEATFARDQAAIDALQKEIDTIQVRLTASVLGGGLPLLEGYNNNNKWAGLCPAAGGNRFL